MKILVTGGAGFIGSNYLNKYVKLEKNNQYFCFDKLTYAGNLNNLEKVLKLDNFHFIKGDISSLNELDNLFSKNQFDEIINFAAETHVDRSFNQENLFLKSNFEGVKNLLSMCTKYHIKRFHQVSTDEVYGPANDNYFFKESDKLNPTNPYSKAKAIADDYVINYCPKHNIIYTISRSCNVYGPKQYAEKLIPLNIIKVLNHEQMELYGNGENKREWIYVEDVIKAIHKISKFKNSSEIFNISTNFSLSNLEVLNMIKENLIDYFPSIKNVKDRKINDYQYKIDSSKFFKYFKLKINTDFIKGLRRTINYYKRNK